MFIFNVQCKIFYNNIPALNFRYDDILQHTQPAWRWFTCESIELDFIKILQYDFNKVYVRETFAVTIDSFTI